jgi:hypothetical protein
MSRSRTASRRKGASILAIVSSWLAVAAVPVLAMVALDRSSGSDGPSGVPESERLELASQGHVVPTESPRAKEFVNTTKRRIRTNQNSGGGALDATARSGLTKTPNAPNVFNVFGVPDSGGLPVIKTVPGGAADDAIIGSTGRGRSGGSGVFRTLCVRLCDGYYWPVSYGASSGGLADDEAVCQSSCGSPVKLYYTRTGDIEDAVDLRGRAYERLKNAFRYREVYDAQCKCKPDPWEEASLERHKTYALLAKAGKLAVVDNGTKRKKVRKNKSYDDGTTAASLASYTVNAGSTLDAGDASAQTTIGTVTSVSSDETKSSKRNKQTFVAQSTSKTNKIVNVMKLGGTSSSSKKLAATRSKKKSLTDSVYGSRK